MLNSKIKNKKIYGMDLFPFILLCVLITIQVVGLILTITGPTLKIGNAIILEKQVWTGYNSNAFFGLGLPNWLYWIFAQLFSAVATIGFFTANIFLGEGKRVGIMINILSGIALALIGLSCGFAFLWMSEALFWVPVGIIGWTNWGKNNDKINERKITTAEIYLVAAFSIQLIFDLLYIFRGAGKLSDFLGSRHIWSAIVNSLGMVVVVFIGFFMVKKSKYIWYGYFASALCYCFSAIVFDDQWHVVNFGLLLILGAICSSFILTIYNYMKWERLSARQKEKVAPITPLATERVNIKWNTELDDLLEKNKLNETKIEAKEAISKTNRKDHAHKSTK